jgi:predicted porin
MRTPPMHGRPRTLAVSFAGAAAASCTFVAQAQSTSTVTIYGIVDAGVERVSNVGPSHGSVSRMPSLTGTLPSRLGFRGSDDLGDGLRALFVLEQGFAPDQGTLNQGGRAWGRQAYVGLSGAWGQLSLGRQYSQIFYSLIGDTLAPNIYAAGVLDLYLPQARVDNAIAYRGTFGPWTAGATYSLGRDAVAPLPAGGCAGETADSKACRHISGELRYAVKEWGVSVAFDRNWGGAGAGSPLPSSSQTDTRKLVNGFYNIGDTATIGAGFQRRDNEGAPQSGASTTARSDYWWLGGTLRVSNLSYDLQYGSLKYHDSTIGDGARVLAARVMYHLSKRTATYLSAGRIDNKGNTALSIDGGNITGSAPLAGGNQNGVMVGIRHFF